MKSLDKKKPNEYVIPIVIRKDLYTTIKLPTDLTAKEAERICKILLSLAIEEKQNDR